MSARIRMLIVATGLTLVMGGCDRGWQEFQQVELGQVLPQQSLLRPHHSKADTAGCATDAQAAKMLTWSDYGVWPVPLSLGMHVVAVRTNDEGRVIAKSYHAQAWSNYVLLTAAALRRVVELQVPPRMFLEPTAKTEDDGMLVGVERSRTLRGYIINAMHETDPSPDCDGEPSAPLLLLAAGQNFMTGMSAAGGFHDLHRSIEHLPLEGVAQDGYDRTFRPVPGGSIRLQNLGQRRIRIEMNLFRLYDPLALTAYMYVQP